MGTNRQIYISCVINAKNQNERRQENHKIGVKEAIFHSLDAMAVRKTLQDREPSARRERAKVGELCECLEEEKLRLQWRQRSEERRQRRAGRTSVMA